jgi:hypothetical protein
MNIAKLAGLTLGAALALGFATAGQAAPTNQSRNGEIAKMADAPVVKVTAKKHKSSKPAKGTTHETAH